MNILILFATSNKSKLKEAIHILQQDFIVESLDSIQYTKTIEEPFETFKENAIIKAQTIADYTKHKKLVFSEDSGLEIEALNFQPGVRSARFAGNQATSIENVKKVLSLMKNISNRKAQFRTIICLIKDKETYLFEGITKGFIAKRQQGSNGFGYDSIFMPTKQKITFSKMTLEKKTLLSHRTIALEKMRKFLLKNS